MSGRHDLGLPRATARCTADIRIANNLTEFVRVTLKRRDGELHASPTGNQSSGVLSSLSRADGLLIGPARESMLKAGTQATVLLLSGGAGAAADTDAWFEERREARLRHIN
jgi:molybdopterin molybdotransferase